MSQVRILPGPRSRPSCRWRSATVHQWTCARSTGGPWRSPRPARSDVADYWGAIASGCERRSCSIGADRCTRSAMRVIDRRRGDGPPLARVPYRDAGPRPPPPPGPPSASHRRGRSGPRAGLLRDRSSARWPCYPSSAPQQEAGSSPSSSGLGRRPFKAEARVRIPLGARHHPLHSTTAPAPVTTAHAPVEESGRPHLPVKEEIAGSKPVGRARRDEPQEDHPVVHLNADRIARVLS